MDGADPAFGIGEALGIEAVRAPLRLLPVEPILHDDVHGDAARAEALEDVEALLRGLVALAALPQAESPARQHRRLAGETPVARHHVVELRAVDEVIVDALADLRPQRCRRGWSRRLPEQLHPFHALVLRPLELQPVAAPGLKVQAGNVETAQPATPPVDDT